jgi:hypothetical protein
MDNISKDKIMKNSAPFTNVKLFSLIVAVCAIWTAGVIADQWDVLGGTWFPPPGLPSSESVKARDLTTQPAGSLIQACVTFTDGMNLPPFTNAASDYLESPTNRQSTAGNGVMGSDNGLGGTASGTDAPNGHYRIPIIANAGEYVFARCFSTDTITGSVYYADSPTFAAQQVASSSDDGGLTVNTVNPAYRIPFTAVPTAAGPETVTGTVYAVGGGGNNILDSGDVIVEYRLEGAATWSVLDSYPNTDGSFSGTVSAPQFPTNAYVRARVKDSATPRRGLPLSDEQYVQNIQGAAVTPVVSITGPNGGNDYSVNIGTHTTNIIGTVDSTPDTLWWTNTLTQTGGALTPGTGFTFPAGLAVGANVITVYAENPAGQGSDTITITVSEPPVPVVTITGPNGGSDYSVSIGLHTTNITGTVDFTTESLWWTNTLTGAAGTLTPGTGFTFPADLAIGANVITVYAGNQGQQGSDTITITVSEPPAPVVTITGPNSGNDYSVNIGAHTTNITGTVDMVPDTLWWTNTLTGAAGTLTSGTDFTFPADLALGVNVITVYAENQGQQDADTITITVSAPEAPVVTVNTPNSGASYTVDIGAHVTNVAGTVSVVPDILRWTNALTGTHGELTPGTAFDFQAVLAVGENSITVYAVKQGQQGADTITITVNEPPVPMVTITGPNGGSDYSVAIGAHTTNITGTVDMVPGTLWLTNTLTGASGTLTPDTGFSFPAGLAIGVNVITVYADNLGRQGSDTITITVSDPPPPVVEITAPNSGDNYSVAIGLHTTNITGTVDVTPDVLWWTNTLTGAGGTLTPGTGFDVPVTLAVGVNQVTVFAGKNGATGSDTIIITVSDPTAPVVELTRPNSGDDYSINIGSHGTNIAGTVSEIPDTLWWTNTLTGAGGTLTPDVSFAATVDLAVGVNTVTVYADKNGATGSDTITITATEPDPPQVTIVLPNNGEDYSTDIGAHTTNVFGTVDVVPDSLWWTNTLTGTGGVLTPDVNFIFGALLDKGINRITVYAEKDGQLGSAAMAITVTQPTNAPVVTIVLPNSGNDYSVGIGPHTTNVVGTVDVQPDRMWWTNSLTGAGSSLTPGLGFLVPAALEEGVNPITVYAEKDGITGSDSITITVTGGTQAPIVTIAAPNGGVDYSIDAGAHSTNVIGVVDSMPDTLWWTNTLSGAGGSLTPATGFNIPVDLSVGVNVITVSAEKDGQTGSDTITITVTEPGELTVNITTPNGGQDYSLIILPHVTNVSGVVSDVPDGLVWSNALTGAGGTLTAATTFGFDAFLTSGVNSITVYAEKDGDVYSDTITITIVTADQSVLCTWPRYIGETQTGTVEFTALADGPYTLFAGSNTVATGMCSAGWNLVTFYGGNLPDQRDDSSNILHLVVGEEPPKKAGTVTVVDDLEVLPNVPNVDFDGDLLYIKYKGSGRLSAQGRTVYISGGSSLDNLSIRVKAARGTGDGAFALCGVISDSGMKGIRHFGDIDKLQIDGPLNKLLLKGGNLGHACRTRLYNIRFDSAAGKSKVLVKAGKHRTTKQFIGGSLQGNILCGTLNEFGKVESRGVLKMLALRGGDAGIEEVPRWLNAEGVGKIFVKPIKFIGGGIIDYSFYLSGQALPGVSVGKLIAYEIVDTSETNANLHLVCGYDGDTDPLTVTNWLAQPVDAAFGKMIIKGPSLQGTIVIKKWPKGFKTKHVKFFGTDDASWILDGEEQ